MKSLPQNMRNALLKAQLFRRAKTFAGTHSYSCFLDEQPSELNLRGAGRTLQPSADGAGLTVNSSFRYQPGSNPPIEILQRVLPLDSFLCGYPIAWVEDPGTNIWSPFWARGEWVEVLQSLRPGQPAPSGMSPAVRRTLTEAHILVPGTYEESTRARWQDTCRSACAQYQAEGYAVVHGMIDPLHISAMRRYYRAIVAQGGLPLGDSQVPGRYVVHSEVLASFFHPQLESLVSRVAGEPVKPSYVYFASYRPGAALAKHVDRAQCQFSISLLADYVPESEGPCGWPLYMEYPNVPDSVRAADLAVGDGVFYKGRELLHSRQPLPEGHQSTSLFLHYVPKDFAGDLW